MIYALFGLSEFIWIFFFAALSPLLGCILVGISGVLSAMSQEFSIYLLEMNSEEIYFSSEKEGGGD